MALDFSKYLDVQVDTIERPSPPPVGHYFATIKSWKTGERDYAKASGGPKTPVVELTFSLTSPDTDIDEALLPANGIANRLVQKDYSLNEENGQFQLRFLAEETCHLDVKGLSLADLLPQLNGQEVKLYLEQRAGQDDAMFPVVKKVLAADA